MWWKYSMGQGLVGPSLGRRMPRSIVIAEQEIERIKNELQNKEEIEVNVYEIMSNYFVGNGCAYTVLGILEVRLRDLFDVKRIPGGLIIRKKQQTQQK
jgi:hypothetical protein